MQIKIDALQEVVDSINKEKDPDRPKWNTVKYKKQNSEHVVNLRKKRLDHLSQYNAQVLKQ